MKLSAFIDVIYQGQTNTPEGIKKAFEAGLILEPTKTDLLKYYKKQEMDMSVRAAA